VAENVTPDLLHQGNFRVKAVPSDVKAESFIFNGARQSTHYPVLFQHHARRAQVRKLISRSQSCGTGAEDHYSGLVVTCSHGCVCGSTRPQLALRLKTHRASEKAASPYLCTSAFLSRRCQE